MHKYYALVTRTSHIGNMPQRYYYGSIYGINNNFSAFAIVHRFLGTLIVFYVIIFQPKKEDTIHILNLSGWAIISFSKLPYQPMIAAIEKVPAFCGASHAFNAGSPLSSQAEQPPPNCPLFSI